MAAAMVAAKGDSQSRAQALVGSGATLELASVAPTEATPQEKTWARRGASQTCAAPDTVL
jgi:hypothetical protein